LFAGFSAGFGLASGGFGFVLCIGGADQTRFNASLKGIAGVSFFSGGGILAESMYGLPKLYHAIGVIVTQWSFVEQSLDSCVALIYHAPGGDKLDDQIPASTLRKTDLIKRGLKKLPHLAPYRDDGLALIQRVMDTKDQRHQLVHSVLTDPQHANGVYSYVGLKAKGGFHYVKPWQFDLKAFPATEQTLKVLANDLLDFSKRLLDEMKARAAPLPPGL
jgi:hypothetical protein